MKSKEKITVVLADDHLVVRMGIISLLSLEDDVSVVGEAEDGLEAVRLAKELRPDIVLMDLMMPRLDGADATARIAAEAPGVKTLILTTFTNSADLRKAMDAGACGALVKSLSREELIDAIRRTLAGERVISPEIERPLRELRSAPLLTARQVEVLNLVSKGFSNPEIGKILGFSSNGVKDHLRLIFNRLGVSSRTEATRAALSLGIIPE